MAGRITEEQKELINELYAELGVKKSVAEIVGCSPSTVTKYLIEGYVPKANRLKIVFEGEPTGCDRLIKEFSEIGMGVFSLSDEEQSGLEALKKEIF